MHFIISPCGKNLTEMLSLDYKTLPDPMYHHLLTPTSSASNCSMLEAT